MLFAYGGCENAYAVLGDEPEWIKFTHFVASPQGRIWLNTDAGHVWMTQQLWLKDVDLNQAPPSVKVDLTWLKAEYLKSKPVPPAKPPVWPTLGCTGYFNSDYRTEALNRVQLAKNTSGDIVLFVGDSLTQLWTDAVVSLKKPSCGNSQNSGIDSWGSIPGTKVNLGLYGIRSCQWTYEYDRFFRTEISLSSARVKAVVINLGTNDIIQLANTSQNPSGEIRFIKQLIEMMKADLPNAQFYVTSISPCLNTLCGNQARVGEFNSELMKQLGSVANVRLFSNILVSDLTMDKIHFLPSAYKKTADVLRADLKGKASYPSVSIPQCGGKVYKNEL